jgi:dTMP kinase
VLLDAPVAVGMSRANDRGALDRFEQEQLKFFEAVRSAYLAQAQQHPQRYRVVDASQPLAAVQQSLAVIFEAMLATSKASMIKSGVI